MGMGRGEEDECDLGGNLRSAGGLPANLSKEKDFMNRLRLQFRFEKDRRLQQLQLDVRRNYTYYCPIYVLLSHILLSRIYGDCSCCSLMSAGIMYIEYIKHSISIYIYI